MRTALCIAVAGTLAGAVVAGLPGAARAASVEVARSDRGLTLVADGARLEDVLEALAAQEGFDVVMQLGVERSPVDVDLRDVTLEEALRRVLRRRSYAISYEEGDDGLAVSRVHVLLPISSEQGATAQPTRRPLTPAALEAQQRSLELRREQARQRQVQQTREKRAAEQRRVWAERARQAQRANEALSEEPAPLRRLLWGRSR